MDALHQQNSSRLTLSQCCGSHQAIAALGQALQADPNNAEVLLSLGVSHTNELDQAQALTYLHSWMTSHRQHSQAAASVPVPADSSQRLSYVVREFEAAAAQVGALMRMLDFQELPIPPPPPPPSLPLPTGPSPCRVHQVYPTAPPSSSLSVDDLLGPAPPGGSLHWSPCSLRGQSFGVWVLEAAAAQVGFMHMLGTQELPTQGATGPQKLAGVPRFRASACRVAHHESNAKVVQSTRALLKMPERPRQGFCEHRGRAWPPRSDAGAVIPCSNS